MSLLLGSVGLVTDNSRCMLAGALVGSPFLLYLALTPRFGWIALLVAGSYAGAAVAAYRDRQRLARYLFTPMVALVVYVAWVVGAAAGG